MKKYYCFDCQSFWELDDQAQEPVDCPKCNSENIVGLVEAAEE